MVTYLEWLLTIKWHNTLFTWACNVTWQTNHYISSTRVPMATKRDRMVTYFERLLTIKSFYALITWSCKVTWQKIFISITRVPMANKLGRIMTLLDGLLPIITHDPLIMWPCEIRGSLTWGVWARKRLSRHRLVVIMQMVVSVAIMQVVFSASPYAHDCFYLIVQVTISGIAMLLTVSSTTYIPLSKWQSFFIKLTGKYLRALYQVCISPFL